MKRYKPNMQADRKVADFSIGIIYLEISSVVCEKKVISATSFSFLDEYKLGAFLLFA